ncbi:relaxase/mobilization nuclease domain-containing protein [Levilactobacillus brevis]
MCCNVFKHFRHKKLLPFCALAEKLYPAYQSAVYTHIDGEHHILHNHIIVSKVNLETGKKNAGYSRTLS